MKVRILAMIFCVALPSAALADLRAQISVNARGSIHHAVGIIMTAAGVRQEKDTSVTQRDQESVVVSVPYTEEDRVAGALATALIATDTGELAFGDVVPLSVDDPDNAFVDIPICQEKIEVTSLIEEQGGNLQKLVDIRTQRRAVAQSKIASFMQGPLLEKLRGYEKSFGLADSEELKAEMNPEELVDRLSRLRNSIKSFETHRSKKFTAPN